MGKSRRLSRGASVEESTFAENDDEAERNALFAARAAEAERAKVVKSPGKKAAGADATGGGADSGAASSWGEIAGIYADCIKLCNDNKVNEKNSWSLNLIDHMGDVLSKPGADAATAVDGDTNFQMASCTLDAGVKIYSYRVDSVYSAAFRVLGGLNRTGAAPGDESDAEAEGDGDGAQEREEGAAPPTGKKPARAKPARSAASTLASAASLDGKNVSSGVILDPLFHKVCAAFDKGGARGLLLANLGLHGAHGLALLFDGEGEPEPAADDELAALATDGGALPLSELRALAPSPTAVFELGVCEQLSAFVDGKMAELGAAGYGEGFAPSAAAPSFDASALGSASVSAEPAVLPWVDDSCSDCGSFGAGAGAELAAGDDDDDERAAQTEAYLSELAAADDDDDDDGAAADAHLFDSIAAARDSPRPRAAPPSQQPPPRGSAEGAGALCGYEAEEAEPFALYGDGAMRGSGWAGPAHWRFRAAPAAEVVAGKGARAGRKGAPGGMLLDIARADHAANAAAIKVKPARGTTRLTAAALAKAASEPLTLPYDHRVAPESLTALFGRPHVQALKLRALRATVEAAAAAEDGSGARLADEGADAFSDDDGGFGASDDVDLDRSDPDPSAPGAAPAWSRADAAADGGLGDITAPVSVQPPDVSYAKVAKKVNIRLLKESLWHALDGEARTHAKASAQPKELSFKGVMASLAQSSPAEQMKDVSVAYCFICLLHLANEKGLRVVGNDDLTDLTVSQSKATA